MTPSGAGATLGELECSDSRKENGESLRRTEGVGGFLSLILAMEPPLNKDLKGAEAAAKDGDLV